jgi:L-lactate transport
MMPFTPMWQHYYTPVGGSLALSTLVAALPVVALLVVLAGLRKASWIASLAGLLTAAIVAIAVYRMPVSLAGSAVAYGAAQGLFPIGWVVFSAILLYNITVATGRFDIVRASVGNLTADRRLQALLIAFAFGAFIEGAAGFGTPVAVAAAMLTGLGFKPFRAATICLLANTAPVAFGSIGTPLIMLATVTGLPLLQLSSDVGRICAPVSLFIPAYLVLVMGGWKALRGVLPAAALCGVSFGGVQFLVSNYIGAELTDILASLTAVAVLILLMRFWQPSDTFRLEGDGPAHPRTSIPIGQVLSAWTPFALLVVCVLVWGLKPVQVQLGHAAFKFPWPGLHRLVTRMPPVAAHATPYDAIYTFNWLSASGTACLVAALLSALVAGMSFSAFLKVLGRTMRQLVLAESTIAIVLGLAFVMNYSGATGTLGLAFAATGKLFPFFGALLGWMGVFLTGSDTSANALFGSLQVVTATRLHMSPVLMAAANSSGGVMGKMISLQNIAVAAAATSLAAADESKLFRFTLRHSIFLASVIGLIAMAYTYVIPGFGL